MGTAASMAWRGWCCRWQRRTRMVNVEVIPGETAALGGGAILGAPLGHDLAVISLSDLLTPWSDRKKGCVQRREAILLSASTTIQPETPRLSGACLPDSLEYKSGETACGCTEYWPRGRGGAPSNTGRTEKTPVDMFTIVFIGK